MIFVRRYIWLDGTASHRQETLQVNPPPKSTPRCSSCLVDLAGTQGYIRVLWILLAQQFPLPWASWRGCSSRLSALKLERLFFFFFFSISLSVVADIKDVRNSNSDHNVSSAIYSVISPHPYLHAAAVNSPLHALLFTELQLPLVLNLRFQLAHLVSDGKTLRGKICPKLPIIWGLSFPQLL